MAEGRDGDGSQDVAGVFASGRLSRAGFDVADLTSKGSVLPSSSSSAGPELTEDVCRRLLQRLIDGHRATGDTFENPAAQSQEVVIELHDVARVLQVLRDDRALGDELAKLLAAALGQKWDARFREKARLVKEFRTLVQMHRIQGGGQLGGGGTRN